MEKIVCAIHKRQSGKQSRDSATAVDCMVAYNRLMIAFATTKRSARHLSQ